MCRAAWQQLSCTCSPAHPCFLVSCAVLHHTTLVLFVLGCDLLVGLRVMLYCAAALQLRGEEYRRRHLDCSWPETQYVLGDEEQLPLEPGTVDGEGAWGVKKRAGGMIRAFSLPDMFAAWTLHLCLCSGFACSN